MSAPREHTGGANLQSAMEAARARAHFLSCHLS